MSIMCSRASSPGKKINVEFDAFWIGLDLTVLSYSLICKNNSTVVGSNALVERLEVYTNIV